MEVNHEYEGMGPDYDEYDTCYDNALVEKQIRQKQLLEERQATATNSSNANTANIIVPLYDSSTSNEQTQPKSQRQSSHGSSSSIPDSPKAKSAPATPCNMTPTAFHQHNPNDTSSPRGATISGGVCIGVKSDKNACRMLLTEQMSSCPDQQQVDERLDELVVRGEQALKVREYQAAIAAFTHCIELAHENHITYLADKQVYGKRAEAHFELLNYKQAIEDSIAARELDPKCAQAYYMEGRAKMLNGDHLDSLPVFAFGLTQDQTSIELLDGLVDAALKSSYGPDFEPKIKKLRSLNMDKKLFVVVSMLGQEILAKGKHIKHAAVILESALKLESYDDKKFKSSVLSTVAYAFCLLEDYEKAITYMQSELEVESELEDVGGQCRVLGNIGFTFYKLRKFDKSLEAHRKQLNLAMKSNLYPQASLALNAIGHVHVARNDFPDALTSHTRCLDILRQLADNEFSQFKEMLSIGHVYSMMNDLKSADERYKEAIEFLKQNTKQNKLSRQESIVGCIMHRFNMAYLSLKRQNLRDAEHSYNEVIKLAYELTKFNPSLSRLFQMRAHNGMGHACRSFKHFAEARGWFEHQLDVASSMHDLAIEDKSQALCNLGMISQHFKDYNQARRYFEENLQLVERHPLLHAYAHSYMASVHFLLGHYGEAQSHYEKSLGIFKGLDYCASERKSIELNIGFVQERVGHQDLSYMNSPNQQSHVTAGIATATAITNKKIMTAS